MQILVLSKLVPGASMDAVAPHLKAETQVAWRLYKDGLVRQWYFRTDQPGVVFFIECESIDEAKRAFEALPLVGAHLIELEYIPLGPFLPLESLFSA